MKKDAFYFPHFSNAMSDEKLVKVRRVFGMEGYGIYFALLETLRNNTDFKMSISSIEDYAYDWHISKEKILSLVNDFDLFTVDNKCFYSEKLMLYLQPYIEKSERARSAANKRWKAIKDANAYPNAYPNALQIECKESKEKESKREEIKESKEKESKREEIKESKEKDLNKESSESNSPQPTSKSKILISEKDKGVLNRTIHLFPEDVVKTVVASTPKKKQWLDTVNKLNRIDGFTHDEIEEVIKFGRNDDFWKDNFISILSLRKTGKSGLTKFVTIKTAMNGNRDKQRNGRNTKRKRVEPKFEGL